MPPWRYPFSALVGQERMRLALLLTAVSPRLGGVLIRGEKGTAKSSAVRAFAALLPELEVLEGCRFGCDPAPGAARCTDCVATGRTRVARRRPALVTLPLGTTEDRLLGTLDLEAALQRGERRFEPGLLGRAHRGVLYVDEVNLLEDHLVDVLLDAAAMGWNVVEREGVGFEHPAELALVGTMNPEEGDLRPQLLDRFGLCVDVESLPEVERRAEIVARRLAFERDPVAFGERFRAEDEALGAAVAAARRRLAAVEVPPELALAAARLSLRLGVDGHRADVLGVKAAAAIAALEGRAAATADDLARAAELVYPHRLRRRPFEERTLAAGELGRAVREALAEPPPERAAKKRVAPSP